MRKRNRTKTALLLSALTLCATLSFSAFAQAASTIFYGNQTRAEEFRPYVGSEWGSNWVTKESTKAKVLVFFTRNCVPSVNAVQSITRSAYLNDSTVEIELIDCSASTEAQITSMVQSYGLDSVKDRIYYSPTSYPTSTALWYYVDYPELNLTTQSNIVPVTIILDGDNNIRYAKNNFFSVSEVDGVIATLLEEQNGEAETAPETTAPETTAPETTVPETTVPETSVSEEGSSNTVKLYFMTGSSVGEPGEVFAEFDVPKNARGNTVTIAKTITKDNVPQKDGYTFSHWQERSLKDPSKMGNRVDGFIWTNETDQYIYAQYKEDKSSEGTVKLYFMTGSSISDPGEVFAEFDVPKNARGNTVNLSKTIKNEVPEKEGAVFSHWQERGLKDPSKMGNRINGIIWTNEEDQYIYAQYK